jgi:tetratricopeptide (TPR) repeat protein
MTFVLKLFCAQKTPYQLLLEDGQKLFEKKEFTLAIEKLHELIALLELENPEIKISENKVDKYVIPCLYTLAQAHIELKQYYKANDRCGQLLEFRPNHSKGKKLQGVICVHTGDYKKAMKSIKLT